MKAKSVKGNWSWRTKKLALPSVFLICIFFFLAGFFGSSLFSHSKEDLYGVRPRPRLLESTAAETDKYLLPAGESGFELETACSIFSSFASAEQCESIIDIAKAGLKPSTLALRKGETQDNTKGIRTSTGVFLSASDDRSGT